MASSVAPASAALMPLGRRRGVSAAAKASRAPPSALAVHADGDQWALHGALDIHTLGVAATALRPGLPASVDIAALQRLDTPGALLLHRLRDQGVRLVGVRAEQRALLELVGGL